MTRRRRRHTKNRPALGGSARYFAHLAHTEPSEWAPIGMMKAEELAAFAVRAAYEDPSEAARRELKIHVLDSLGGAIGAVDGASRSAAARAIPRLRRWEARYLDRRGTGPDRAAFYKAALVRYLDFNDSHLAPGETCHPSDSLGPILAAAEYARASGRDLLTALAVAYQVQ